jgi:hypothetical protein
MKNLTATICLALAVLVGSTGQGFALPPCPSVQFQFYHNCFGTFTRANGNKYVGEFRNGKRHGQGTYTWAGGSKYVGEFRNGKIQGEGTFTVHNGDRYVGEFRNDKQHGQGTYTFANGRIMEGIFKDGKFQYAQKVSPPVTARKSQPAKVRKRSNPPSKSGPSGPGYKARFNKLMITARTENADAQFNLGLIYLKGQGTNVDYVRAKMWINISAVNYAGADNEDKRKEAIILGLKLRLMMTKDQKELSNKFGDQCLRSNYKKCP